MAQLIQASNQSSKLRMVPHFGDVAMALQLARSKMWREFYEGSKKPFWRIFVWLMAAKVEMLALPARAIFRYQHGRNTTGIAMGLWAVSMIAALNVEHIIGTPLALFPFLSPFLVFVLDWSILGEYMFVSIRSYPILVFMAIFAVFQMVHVIGLRLKKGRNRDVNKRGNSWLMKLLPKRFSIKEIWVQALIEPILIITLGLVGWLLYGDLAFGLLMTLSGISLSIQELADEMYRMYHGRI